MDTRESSPRLIEDVTQGISLIGAHPINFGLVTTPQLHWLTQKFNQVKDQEPEAYKSIKPSDFNEAWAHYFFEFSKLIGEGEKKKYQPSLLLDCANGVGAPQFKIT
jgi:phosphoacetylglucosamine mutase